MSDGSEHHIVHDVLQFHKVSARWVPRQLTAELKERRFDACQELLKRFEAEGDPSIHLRRYSPLRALASLTRRLHPSLFVALLLHPLVPSSCSAFL